MKVKHVILVLIAFIGCTEPYVLKNEDFQDALVIEATITNEFKKQTITLSRTSPLNQIGQRFEHDAIVNIKTNTGLVYDFIEIGNIYISTQEFSVLPNITYQLTIQTQDGKEYKSTNEAMPGVSQIDDVNSSQAIENNEIGAVIKVSSSDPANNSKFYRYEFEETYKIVAPLFSLFKAEFGPNDEIIVSPRTTETKICYSNSESITINLATTSDQSNDIVYNHSVNFLPKTDPKITNRYSILVKQYVLNVGAYNYYKTLKSLSTSENLLSQIQPGAINGNIKNINNTDEAVIGYFDICTVSTKRHFFNFEDIFPNETSDAYVTECHILNFLTTVEDTDPRSTYFYGGRAALRRIIVDGTLNYVHYEGRDGGVIKMAKGFCGDCTTFSSNIRPSFWVD